MSLCGCHWYCGGGIWHSQPCWIHSYMWHVPMSAMEATQSNNDLRKLGENEECLKFLLAGRITRISWRHINVTTANLNCGGLLVSMPDHKKHKHGTVSNIVQDRGNHRFYTRQEFWERSQPGRSRRNKSQRSRYFLHICQTRVRLKTPQRQTTQQV